MVGLGKKKNHLSIELGAQITYNINFLIELKTFILIFLNKTYAYKEIL
jgi:hypothetical protein